MSAQAAAYAALWPWEPLAPRDVGEILAGLTAPWWITGGWGIDLFLGRVTRRHLDVDVALLRRTSSSSDGTSSRHDLEARIVPAPARTSATASA